MPFDLSSHIGRWTNGFANKSALGKAISHPMWFTIIIVALCVLILYLVGWKGSPTFKLLFYLLSGVFTMVILHDSLIKEQIEELHETDAGTSVVTDITELDRSSELDNVKPRAASDAVQSYMRTNVVSQQIENAQDLLGLVDLD